jgi:membrane protease YdiL (CAAX protease family)
MLNTFFYLLMLIFASWGYAALAWPYVNGAWGWLESAATGWFKLGAMLIPGLVTLVFMSFRKLPWSATLAWKKSLPGFFWPAIFLFPLLAFLAAELSVLLGLAEWDTGFLRLRQMLAAQTDPPIFLSIWLNPGWAGWLYPLYFFLGPFLFLLPSLSEEMAWRGYLLSTTANIPPWLGLALAGIFWWLIRLPWYAHGYHHPDAPQMGVWVGLAQSLALAYVLGWLRLHSRSLWPPVLAHATLVTSATLPVSLTKNTEPIWAHFNGGIGVFLLALLCIILQQFQPLPPISEKRRNTIY